MIPKWMWEEREWTKLEAWVWMITHASDSTLFRTEHQLMQQFRWKTRKKLRAFLQRLEKDQLITLQPTKQGTKVIIHVSPLSAISTTPTIENQDTTQDTTSIFGNRREVWTRDKFGVQTDTTKDTTYTIKERTGETEGERANSTPPHHLLAQEELERLHAHIEAQKMLNE